MYSKIAASDDDDEMDRHFLCKVKRLRQPIPAARPLSPWRSRRPPLLFSSQELNLLIGFGPCRTCSCRLLGQDVLLFVKETCLQRFSFGAAVGRAPRVAVRKPAVLCDGGQGGSGRRRCLPSATSLASRFWLQYHQ